MLHVVTSVKLHMLKQRVMGGDVVTVLCAAVHRRICVAVDTHSAGLLVTHWAQTRKPP